MNNLRNFVSVKLTSLSQSNPMMALMKPLASRIIDNNMYKVEALLKQISDKDGLVDVEGILTEMSDNIINTKPFKVETGLLGQLEIGAGKIKMDIPMVNKSLVLNQQDLNELKDMLSHQKSEDGKEWYFLYHSFLFYKICKVI